MGILIFSLTKQALQIATQQGMLLDILPMLVALLVLDIHHQTLLLLQIAMQQVM